jgi:hypothetical protein
MNHVNTFECIIFQCGIRLRNLIWRIPRFASQHHDELSLFCLFLGQPFASLGKFCFDLCNIHQSIGDWVITFLGLDLLKLASD